MVPKKRNVRILCHDGGGIKGVTSLRMLKEIMIEVDNIWPGAEKPIKPCQYFDLICGTSTGGLIALMLGRLEYTVDDAIKEYLKLGEQIFDKKLPWLTRWDATYDHKTLEACIKAVVRDAPFEPKLDENALFKDSSRRCKTFVITTSLSENSPEPTILRSYDTESSEPEYAFPGTIWEAGRATSAAPTFFKPLLYDDQGVIRTYSDGATIANNPSYEGIIEACRIWDPSAIDCIVSLGTGPEGEHTLENASIDILGPWGVYLCQKMLSRSLFYRLQLAFYSLHAMTGTERAHHKTTAMVHAFRRSDYIAAAEKGDDPPDEVYFRLNVMDSKAKVGLDAWKEMWTLKDLAEDYMKNDSFAEISKRCIAAILVRTDAEARRRRPLMKGPPENDFQDIWNPKLTFLLPGSTSEYQSARCQIDTGAEKNFVSKVFVMRWNIPLEALKVDQRTKLMIHGDVTIAESRVTLQFALQNALNNAYTAQFYVLTGLPDSIDVILGSKFFFEKSNNVLLGERQNLGL